MKPKSTIFSTITALALVILSLASTLPVLAATVTGVVMDADKVTIANATVWLIPAADIASMAKTPISIKRDASNDEPLEDNLAANRNRYQHAKTDSTGKFSLNNTGEGKFFLYVEPADSKYLPGGDKSRNAMSTKELSAAPLTIKISGNIPVGSTYVGTSKCLKCHEDQEHFTQTLHRLGIKALGKDSKLQDYSRFPDFNQGLDKLMAGTKFWLYNFDKKRSFDKYMISDHQPDDLNSVSYTATFYKDSDGTLKFRTENVRDPSDPARVYPVELTYGGGLYKQRYVYRVGANLFPFVQFNTYGEASYGSRTRKPWRDYHGDWLFDEKIAKLKNPPQGKSFDKNCASCHYSGYSLTKTAKGDYIAGSTNDKHGELDIDGDGEANELNMGCETCHGPGSVHAKSEESVSIVSPDKLASERASMICGQCHDRAQGHLKTSPAGWPRQPRPPVATTTSISPTSTGSPMPALPTHPRWRRPGSQRWSSASRATR